LGEKTPGLFFIIIIIIIIKEHLTTIISDQVPGMKMVVTIFFAFMICFKLFIFYLFNKAINLQVWTFPLFEIFDNKLHVEGCLFVYFFINTIKDLDRAKLGEIMLES
jgi:hypothetical protein